VPGGVEHGIGAIGHEPNIGFGAAEVIGRFVADAHARWGKWFSECPAVGPTVRKPTSAAGRRMDGRISMAFSRKAIRRTVRAGWWQMGDLPILASARRWQTHRHA
jgi:hypothetical protein